MQAFIRVVGAFVGTYTFPQIIDSFGGATKTLGTTVMLPSTPLNRV